MRREKMGTKKERVHPDCVKAAIVAAAIVAVLSMGFGMARAQGQEVKIGVIYPLSGPVAHAGNMSKDAVSLCADYVNNKWPDLPIPIGNWEGIPGLNGAKIKLIFADHRGEPDRGADLAKKLIIDEKVVGICGCYHSSVTKTVSTVCERHKIPMINPESTSPVLTKRGYQWFFRATPHDRIFVRDFFEFLGLLHQGKVPGVKAVPKSELRTIGACTENTEWGAGTRDVIKEFAKQYGYEIVSDVTYPHESPDLTAEVRRLLAPKPDILMFASYISDAILLTKTMKEFKAKAKVFWSQDVGFYQPKYIETFGNDTEGILNRTVFSKKLFAVKPVAKNINVEFKKRSGVDFMGTSARAFTGMQAWAYVLNEAGSTDPEAIRKTAETIEIPGKDLIVPWKGIKFEDVGGETNQNTWSSGLIVQYQAQEPEIIYPLDVATAKFVYPWPGLK
ncbi:MAG: branched-chain amino acid ABC transporter substrate-binding protein [Deltaproteobacteria bacterium]|nr:MAG: branched-chain amino acid ABC transporter substrate-binding protein [Deltaproteobacteria bacterium]